MITGNPPRPHPVGAKVRPGVLAVSAVVHGAVLALIVVALPDTPEAPPVLRGRFTVHQPDPIEITLLSGDALETFNPSSAPPAPRSDRTRRSSTSNRADSARDREPGAAGTRVERFESVPGQPLETAGGGFTNGKTSSIDLGLAPDVASRIAAGGAPASGKAVESGRLESVSGGGGVIHDRVTTVTVERDGTAHFHDKPDVDLHWQVPIPHLDVKQDLHDLGDALEDWYRDPYKLTRYGTTSELSEIAKAVPGACDGWGSVMCDDPLAPDAEQRAKRHANSTVGLGGAADISAWLMRKYGHFDPYAARKLKLLDETRAEREERGEQFRDEQAARSAELMQKNILEMWARIRDPVHRREALYELWNDCGDDEAGLRARAMVIGWIRSHMPPGSADAFTADELSQLAPFSPYEQ